MTDDLNINGLGLSGRLVEYLSGDTPLRNLERLLQVAREGQVPQEVFDDARLDQRRLDTLVDALHAESVSFGEVPGFFTAAGQTIDRLNCSKSGYDFEHAILQISLYGFSVEGHRYGLDVRVNRAYADANERAITVVAFRYPPAVEGLLLKELPTHCWVGLEDQSPQ